MSPFMIVINVLLIINALVLVVSVLMQEGSRTGLGTIAGGAETFFGKSKGRSYEGKLEMITKVGVATFIVLTMLMTTLNARMPGATTTTPIDTSNMPKTEDLLKQKERAIGSGIDTTLPEVTLAPEATDAPVAEDKAVTPAETTEATVVPTVVPTAEPTVAPTTAPTAAPTVAPTVAVTVAPTEVPAA